MENGKSIQQDKGNRIAWIVILIIIAILFIAMIFI